MGTVDIQRAGQDVGVDLAGVGKLLADGARAAFCLALLDGRAWTANELARYAGVAPSTATSHLNLLTANASLRDEAVLREGPWRRCLASARRQGSPVRRRPAVQAYPTPLSSSVAPGNPRSRGPTAVYTVTGVVRP